MPRTPEDKIDFEKYAKYAHILEKTKWAEEFSWDHVRKICHYIHPVMAKKGAVIFREGDREETFGIIVKGSIDILKQGDRENRKVATLQSSQTFGEMSLLDGEPRSATGIAAEDSIIFFISKKDLLDISEDHPRLGFQLVWKISKLLSQRLRNTTGKLIDYMGQ